MSLGPTLRNIVQISIVFLQSKSVNNVCKLLHSAFFVPKIPWTIPPPNENSSICHCPLESLSFPFDPLDAATGEGMGKRKWEKIGQDKGRRKGRKYRGFVSAV